MLLLLELLDIEREREREYRSAGLVRARRADDVKWSWQVKTSCSQSCIFVVMNPTREQGDGVDLVIGIS